jgi:hypothetical protein
VQLRSFIICTPYPISLGRRKQGERDGWEMKHASNKLIYVQTFKLENPNRKTVGNSGEYLRAR